METKADWQNPRDKDHNYIDSLFVKTFAYNKIKTHSVFFLIGRKGSGKSTVVDVLANKESKKSKEIIKVDADEFNLEHLYGFLYKEQVRSDMRNIFRRQTCFQFAWEAFLYICCIEKLIEPDKIGDLSEQQNKHIEPLMVFIEKIRQEEAKGTDAPLNKSPYFTYSFNSVGRFIDSCIKKARTELEFFYSDIEFQFALQEYLYFVFGEKVLYSFQEIIATCKRGFLITLDGFDTAFDTFRRDTTKNYKDVPDALRLRTDFEIDWLRSFLQLVLKIKQNKAGIQNIHSLMEFCITVPKDRFLELLRTERDSYRYGNRYCSLNWSGIELAILLGKRLEELSQYSTDKRKSPEERLSNVLETKFGHIPDELTFTFNEKQYSMPLYMYVLRHTFWRPRDILLYYAKIISTSESMRRKGHKVTTEAMRRAVKDTTFEVIKDEFINEFVSTISNIREILDGFHRCTQIISYDRVANILTQLHFEYASGVDNANDINEKIEFLYQIGFIGILASQDMCNRYNLKSKYAFYFNEGIMLLRTVGQEKYKDFTFIIHPIFCEYLELNTADQELILQFNWDDLHDMEDLLFASGTNFIAF